MRSGQEAISRVSPLYVEAGGLYDGGLAQAGSGQSHHLESQAVVNTPTAATLSHLILYLKSTQAKLYM